MADPALLFADQAVVGFIAGFVVGALHFASLRWNTRLFTTGAAGKAMALQLGRIAGTVAALTLLARVSLVALLSGGLGFLVARLLLLWRFGGPR
jgi:F1F0 ATPase subunit 2